MTRYVKHYYHLNNTPLFWYKCHVVLVILTICNFCFLYQCRNWVDKFLSLREKREGFQRSNITPYIHVMLYHVPGIIKRLGSMKMFSGQGVEKQNDASKRDYHSSQKHRTTEDMLVHSHRLRKLASMEMSDGQPVRRQPRSYEKKSEYWNKIKCGRYSAAKDVSQSTNSSASEDESWPSCLPFIDKPLFELHPNPLLQRKYGWAVAMAQLAQSCPVPDFHRKDNKSSFTILPHHSIPTKRKVSCRASTSHMSQPLNFTMPFSSKVYPRKILSSKTLS